VIAKHFRNYSKRYISIEMKRIVQMGFILRILGTLNKQPLLQGKAALEEFKIIQAFSVLRLK
jgi:hypothetical protein